MRVLLVENDDRAALDLRGAMEAMRFSVEVIAAESRASALAAVAARTYDLVILDLSIPTVDGALDESEDHGLELLRLIQVASPGTPIFVFSAFATIANLGGQLAETAPMDIYGSTRPFPMLQSSDKTSYAPCLAQAESIGVHLQALVDIEVLSSLLDPLGDERERLLRVFARRKSGATVSVDPVSGVGLSGAAVARVRVEAEQGGGRASVVVKFGKQDQIRAELERYEKYVVATLAPTVFAPLAGVVDAMIGGEAALFYALADENSRSLFELLEVDPDAAADAVRRIRAAEQRWTTGAPRRQTTVGNLRRDQVSDELLMSHPAATGLNVRSIEEHRVMIAEAIQHRDLHGLNVIVDGAGTPIIIDYGDVGLAAIGTDAVMLELSLLFHPAGRAMARGWPSLDVAKHWIDLDEYTADCPFAGFIRATREWALANSAGVRAVRAIAYAHSLRQLRYEDVPPDLAVAVAQSAVADW